MNIPHEAVEAAARVAYSDCRRSTAEYGVDLPSSFDDLPEHSKALFRAKVRPFLVAAVPHLADLAAQEAADAEVRGFWRAVKPGSYCSDGPVRDEDRAGYLAAWEFFNADGGKQ